MADDNKHGNNANKHGNNSDDNANTNDKRVRERDGKRDGKRANNQRHQTIEEVRRTVRGQFDQPPPSSVLNAITHRACLKRPSIKWFLRRFFRRGGRGYIQTRRVSNARGHRACGRHQSHEDRKGRRAQSRMQALPTASIAFGRVSAC